MGMLEPIGSEVFSMFRFLALLLVYIVSATPCQAQEEAPASSPATGSGYRMERNLLRTMQIRVSRARQLCAAARQKDDPQVETYCADVPVQEAQMQQVCDSAIAKGVTGAVGLCNSMLHPQQ